MLSELHVRDFALMADVRLELGRGMTVFTGETGAGKSMLVDALGAAFGARASSDQVRHGAERAEVNAVIRPDARARALLAEHELDADDDEVVIRRVIRADGGSRAWVNGAPAPARLLKALGEGMLDMHGQHEHQSLLRPAFQKGLLDARVEAALLARTKDAFAAWREASRELRACRDQREQDAREQAWMRDELARLTALDVREGLLGELEARVSAGRNFARIQQTAAEVLDAVEDADDAVRARLGRCLRALEEIAALRPEAAEALELLAQAEALAGEAAPPLRGILDEAFDPAALEADEQRLMDLHEAMRRNDTDEAGLVALRARLEEKLSRLDAGGWDEETLARQAAECRQAYLDAAGRLSEARRQAAGELARELRPFLDRLALAGMRVAVEVTPHAEDEARWGADGFDAVRLRVSSNPGEPFRDLADVASGGELSRLALALKGCGALRDAPGIAVFDEVDAGIGGETAWAVGELLAEMGRERQVLVISHLPQVAACAARHVHIRKHVEGGRTVTRLEVLDDAARRREIGRMLGGVGEESLRHADALMARAREAARA